MTYEKWTRILCDYYQSKCSSQLILHITKEELVDFVKSSGVELAPKCPAAGYKDELVFKDFVRKFYLQDSDHINESKEDLIKMLQVSMKNRCNEGMLPIAAILMMPICGDNDNNYHGNEYYEHLYDFLVENQFCKEKKTEKVEFFKGFDLGTLWNNIASWAESVGLNFNGELATDNRKSHQYVRTLMRENLLKPSQIQRFCLLFEKAGFAPNSNIEKSRLLNAFKNHSTIGISEEKARVLEKDHKDYLSSMLRKEYEIWDGNTYVKEKNEETGKETETADDSCYSLLLYMNYDPNLDSKKFGLILYSSDMENYETVKFETENKDWCDDIYMESDGYANKPFYNIIDDKLEDKLIQEQGNAKIKGRFMLSNYYILKPFRGGYVAVKPKERLVRGQFYFVVIKKSDKDLDEWLTKNNAQCKKNENIFGEYSLYRIEKAVDDSLPSYSNFSFEEENKVKCVPFNNIEVKMAEDKKVRLFSDLFPAQFEINGIDISSDDKVRAVSIDNNGKQDSKDLNYCREKQLWKFDVPKDAFQRDREFCLYYNDTKIPNSSFKFEKFISPETFNELSLDKWGGTENDDFPISQGLKLPDEFINKTYINWDTIKTSMRLANPTIRDENSYKKSDYLLYAITTASFATINRKWFDEILDRLRLKCELNGDEKQPDKFASQNILADYFKMGYLNFAYDNSKGLSLAANRPSLVLLAPKYKRVEGNVTELQCVDNEFSCLLTGGRTIELIEKIEGQVAECGCSMNFVDEDNPLLPQKIYIYANAKEENPRECFVKLSERCGLFFQNNIYAEAMLQMLPSVDEYIQYIKSKGEEQDLSYVKQFRSLDYVKMKNLFDAGECKCIRNEDVNKSKYDEQTDVVTFYPGMKHNEITVMINDGKMFKIDKYWGHLIGMRQQNAKVFSHDGNYDHFDVPLQIKLPLLYERALTLLNGNVPEVKEGKRSYGFVLNPMTDACKAQTILNKLGQN
jgi:hypothetical protein